MEAFVYYASWLCGIIGFIIGLVGDFKEFKDSNLFGRIILGLVIGAFAKGISYAMLSQFLI